MNSMREEWAGKPCTCDQAKKANEFAICAACYWSGRKLIEGDVQFVCYTARGLNVLHRKACDPKAKAPATKGTRYFHSIDDRIRSEQSSYRESHSEYMRANYPRRDF